MITTSGFPVRAGLAHHCQGQPPNSMLVRLIFDELYASRTSDIHSRRSLDSGQPNQTCFVSVLSEKEYMMPHQLDYWFPFFVFFYGFLILLVLEGLPAVVRNEIRAHPWFEMIQKRKSLAWICFFIGGLWSLQNIWIS